MRAHCVFARLQLSGVMLKRIIFSGLALVCVSANALSPWEAVYDASTRTTSASVSRLPTGPAWTAAQGAIERAAASSAYRVALTGSIPGPLGPASMVGRFVVGAGTLLSSVHLWGALAALSAGGALWGLYQSLGASIGPNGEVLSYIEAGEFTWLYGGVEHEFLKQAIDALEGGICAPGVGYVCGSAAPEQSLLLLSNLRPEPGANDPSYLPIVADRKSAVCTSSSTDCVWDTSVVTVTIGWVYGVRRMKGTWRDFDLRSEYEQATDPPDLGPAVETGVKQGKPVEIPKTPVALEGPLPAPQVSEKRRVDNPTAAQRAAAGVDEGPIWLQTRFTPRLGTDPKTGTPGVVWDAEEIASPDAGSSPGTPVVGSGTQGGEETESESADICKLYPDILACAKVGTAADDVELPEVQQPVSVAPFAFGPSNGTCPAGTITIGGRPFPGFFDVLCNWLEGLRFVVLGVCGFVAARILVGAAK